MDIIAQLNEKLSAYQSPKVNWFNKRSWLLKTIDAVGIVAIAVTLAVLFEMVFSWVLSFPALETSVFRHLIILLGFLSCFVLAPSIPWAVYKGDFSERKGYPKREKVVGEYIDRILKTFQEKEFQTIKIQLLKILNDEPYTPVKFFDEMIAAKNSYDQQQWDNALEKDKAYFSDVKDPSSFTVLIEKMEEAESAEIMQKDADFEKRMESISRL